MLFSLNKNKIRKSKTLVNRKFFPQKRNILSKKVSKAKILARIVFFFFNINIIIQTRVQPLKGALQKEQFYFNFT